MITAAEAAMSSGELGRAGRLWQELQDRYPDCVWGPVGYARVLAALGQHERAEAFLREAIALRPGVRELVSALGDVLLLRERWHEAYLVWSGIRFAHPGFLWGHVNTVRAADALGRAAEAWAVLAAAKERFPEQSGLLADVEAGLRHPVALAGFADQSATRTGCIGSSGEEYDRDAVHIYNITFFDFEGRKVYPGGAERYLYDLVALFKRRGLRTVIYQAGTTRWTRHVEDLRVEAFPWQGDVFRLSRTFADETRPGVLNIYSPFTLAVADRHEPSVGICHGVYWDVPGTTILDGTVSRDVFSALLHLGSVVSVDANSINAIRSVRPDLADRMRYIPNYVGGEFFQEAGQEFRGRRSRILYPRRLYKARGYWLLANSIPGLLMDFPELEFAFVGDADPSERRDVMRLKRAHPGNVEFLAAHPAEMPQQYRRADISVIPTVNSEGTSLSALEALASGNAVVATNVGGLSNILIDELNGLLVQPQEQAVADAIRRLVSEPDLCARLRANGRLTAHAFRKEKWVAAWEDTIDGLAPQVDFAAGGAAVVPGRGRIVHPRVDGIAWGLDPDRKALMRQRPHHLLRALHGIGVPVTTVSDEPQGEPKGRDGGTWEVLGHGAQVYASDAVVLIYYAYCVWALGQAGEAWLRTLQPEQRASFESTDDHHRLQGSKVWFDLLDDPSLHEDPLYAEAVELFIVHADFVTTSSRVLRQRYSARRPDMLLVENACNPQDFAPPQGGGRHGQLSDVERDLLERKDAGSRILGYVGAIAPWFDFDILDRLAADFPLDHVAIIGPVSPSQGERVRLASRAPNVCFYGYVPYEHLPPLLRLFDVALLPFRINPVTDVTNPVKLYEYLASGLPVVATRMQELERIAAAGTAPGLRLASDAEAFCTLVEAAMDKATRDTEAGTRRLDWSAFRNAWLSRATDVLFLLQDGGVGPYGQAARGIVCAGLAAGRNRLDPDRAVRVNHTAGGWLTVGLSGNAVLVGDEACVHVPLLAGELGHYRLDLVISYGPTTLPPGQIRHAVWLNEQILAEYDPSTAGRGLRVVATVECERGLQRLALAVTATGAEVGWPLKQDTELRCEQIAFRRSQDRRTRTLVQFARPFEPFPGGTPKVGLGSVAGEVEHGLHTGSTA